MASPTPNDLTRQQLDELDTLLQRMLALPLSKPEPVGSFPPPPPPLPDMPPVPVTPPVRSGGWRADPASAANKSPYLTAATADREPDHAAALVPSFRAARDVDLPSSPSAFAGTMPFLPPTPNPTPATAPAPQPAVALRSFNPPAPTPATDYTPPGGPGTLRGVDAPATPAGFVSAFAAPPEADPPPMLSFDRGGFAEVNPFADLPAVDPVPLAAAEPPAAKPSGRVPVPLWPLFAVNWLVELVLGWMGPVGHLLTRPWMKAVLGWLGVLLLLGAGGWVALGRGWVSWPR